MRGRFAPSPTGYIHLANVWSALLAWLQVRQAGGTLVLRIEDIDEQRSKPIYTQALMEDLHWLGLNWDEGPDVGGPYGPYIQQERYDRYDAALEKLHKAGLLYPCYCSRNELHTASAPHASDGAVIYAGTCRDLTAAELGREETTELAFTVEGETELIPVTLYIGQGYSIYIPSEGWRLEKRVDDGIPEESWESVLNDDVELTVLHLGERTLEQAQDWVRAEEDDYQLVEDKQGGLGGTDTEELGMLEVRFHPSGNGMYAVLYKCPMEAIEGFGTRLSVMADTFQVME